MERRALQSSRYSSHKRPRSVNKGKGEHHCTRYSGHKRPQPVDERKGEHCRVQDTAVILDLDQLTKGKVSTTVQDIAVIKGR